VEEIERDILNVLDSTITPPPEGFAPAGRISRLTRYDFHTIYAGGSKPNPGHDEIHLPSLKVFDSHYLGKSWRRAEGPEKPGTAIEFR
jgi:hypothetical protein